MRPYRTLPRGDDDVLADPGPILAQGQPAQSQPDGKLLFIDPKKRDVDVMEVAVFQHLSRKIPTLDLYPRISPKAETGDVSWCEDVAGAKRANATGSVRIL